MYSYLRLAAALFFFCTFPEVPATASSLTVWSHQPKDTQKAISYLIRQFNARNPNITIRLNKSQNDFSLASYVEGDRGDTGKPAADIFIADSLLMTRWMHKGMLKSIKPNEYADRIFPIALESVTDARRQLWGVPVLLGHHLMLYVNKKMIPSPPKKVSEMIKIAKDLESLKGVRGLAFDLANPYWFVPILAGYGQNSFLKQLPVIDRAAVEKAFIFVHDMKFRWKLILDNCDYLCGVDRFVNSKVGMLVGGDWEFTRIRSKLGTNLAVVKLPLLDATNQPLKSLAYSVAVFFHRSLAGDELKDANKFAKYLVSDAAQQYLMRRGDMLPSVAPISRRSIVRKNWSMSRRLAALESSVSMPVDSKVQFLLRQFRIQLSQVLAGRQQPAAAASLVQKAMQEKYQGDQPEKSL